MCYGDRQRLIHGYFNESAALFVQLEITLLWDWTVIPLPLETLDSTPVSLLSTETTVTAS